jgi:hypothetical protein
MDKKEGVEVNGFSAAVFKDGRDVASPAPCRPGRGVEDEDDDLLCLIETVRGWLG